MDSDGLGWTGLLTAKRFSFGLRGQVYRKYLGGGPLRMEHLETGDARNGIKLYYYLICVFKIFQLLSSEGLAG